METANNVKDDSVGICITYNEDSTYEFVDEDVERGLVMRVIFLMLKNYPVSIFAYNLKHILNHKKKIV